MPIAFFSVRSGAISKLSICGERNELLENARASSEAARDEGVGID